MTNFFATSFFHHYLILRKYPVLGLQGPEKTWGVSVQVRDQDSSSSSICRGPLDGEGPQAAPAGIPWDPLASCEHLGSHQRSRGDATHLCGCILAELGDSRVRSRYLAMAGAASLLAFHHSAPSDWDGHTSMFCE